MGSADKLMAAILLLTYFTAFVGAQNQAQQTYWHNSDYYSIQLNGAGNAFISAELNLQSLSKSPVNAIILEVPYRNISVYQLISTNSSIIYPCPYCAYPVNYKPSAEFVNYSTIQSGNSTLLTIRLNEPLENSSETTLYLFFSTRNIAEKALQGYQFAFNTMIDRNALIRNVYASVEVPQNMYLKGEPSFNISYQVSSAPAEVIAATSASDVAALLPELFYGSYQYQASNLLSGEYFTVSGLYSGSLPLLYLPEIIIAIIGLIVIILLVKFILMPRIRSMFKVKTKRGSSSARPILVGAFSGFIFQVTYYAMQALYSLVGYYYNSPLSILLALLSLVVFALSLFGLPYYLLAKFSKKEVILAGIASIVFGVIYSIIIACLFYSPPIIYPMVV